MTTNPFLHNYDASTIRPFANMRLKLISGFQRKEDLRSRYNLSKFFAIKYSWCFLHPTIFRHSFIMNQHF